MENFTLRKELEEQIKNAMASKENETEFGDIYSPKCQNLLKELSNLLK